MTSHAQITPFGSKPEPGKIEYYASLGVTEVVFQVPPVARPTKALPVLDRIVAVLEGL